MSYKHNDLFAMRERYWSDEESSKVSAEKREFCQILQDAKLFQHPSLEDAKYVFFNLPSIIIIKGYALGFSHPTVKNMILHYISSHAQSLRARDTLKVKFRM